MFQIPASLRTLNSLQSLDLSFNQIPSLVPEGDGAILPLPLLWRLNMASNHLEGVHKEAFKELVSLQILDLSNNNVR